jgi:hypothetical protein
MKESTGVELTMSSFHTNFFGPLSFLSRPTVVDDVALMALESLGD